jgi:polyisoprenoid-binding protein YceI
VVGDLTIRGVTRPVEPVAERTDGGPPPWAAEVASFAATATIGREDVGIGLNLPLQGSELVIGDEVTIAIDVRALKRPVWGR